jgi:hypothetical protein
MKSRTKKKLISKKAVLNWDSKGKWWVDNFCGMVVKG